MFAEGWVVRASCRVGSGDPQDVHRVLSHSEQITFSPLYSQVYRYITYGTAITVFQCTGYDNTAYVDYMDPAVRCSRKAVKLNHSLTHCYNSGRKWIRYKNDSIRPISWASYGVSIARIWDKIDCVIMSPHCISNVITYAVILVGSSFDQNDHFTAEILRLAWHSPGDSESFRHQECRTANQCRISIL